MIKQFRFHGELVSFIKGKTIHALHLIVQLQLTPPPPVKLCATRTEGTRLPFLESPVDISGSKGPVAFWVKLAK